jgi:hypothetical protein
MSEHLVLLSDLSYELGLIGVAEYKERGNRGQARITLRPIPARQKFWSAVGSAWRPS